MNFKEWLESNEPCPDALRFAIKCDFNPKTIWETCKRGDWLIWLLAKGEGIEGFPTRQELVLICCKIARTVLHLVDIGENRPRLVIEAAEGWANGYVDIEDVKKAINTAASATFKAHASDCSVEAIAAAHSAALGVIYTTDYADYSRTSDYAATAVQYSAYAADTTHSHSSVRKAHLKLISDMIRSEFKWECPTGATH